MKKILTITLCILHFALCASAAFYYQPQTGYVGDPMPFYDPVSQNFRIYYLQEFRPNSATYHPVYAVETEDMVNYTTLGEVLLTGVLNTQDAAIGTGSVAYVASTRTYYFYYTGHNDRADSNTGNREKILRATSTDGVHWTKDASWSLSPSPYYYYQHDFRDPEVFWGDDNKYHMVVATGKDGKGCLAEFTSSNCRDWTHSGIFMKCMWDRFYECPNVFKMGNYWYLVYSELHKEIRRVQYFKATTLAGLKACTANDAAVWPDNHEGYLDSRGLYAGKTASDGVNRYLWGWCPTRPNSDNTRTNNSNGEPDWAGTMVCHRILQHADGSLTLGQVDGIASYFNSTVQNPTSVNLSQGQHQIFSQVGEQTHISFTLTTGSAGDKFGISVCRNANTTKYYSLIVNPEANGIRKINFEEEGNGGIGFVPYIDGYLFAQPANGEYNVDIYIDGSVLTMYINDIACYTNRIYGMFNYGWSINCYSGSAQVSNIQQKVYDSNAPMSIENVDATQSTHVTKLIQNGRLIFVRDGQQYTVTGAKL